MSQEQKHQSIPELLNAAPGPNYIRTGKRKKCFFVPDSSKDIYTVNLVKLQIDNPQQNTAPKQ